MIKNFKWLLLVAITITACSKSEDTVVSNSSDGLPLTSGSANFSKYVSLGNSLCAGYSDGALFIEGQKGSYPAILANQFALVGGGEFKIPFMADNLGGFTVGGNIFAGNRMVFNGSAPVAIPGTPTTEIGVHLTGPFNNMGVPGAKSFHLLAPGYGSLAGLMNGTANPFFVRFASSPTASVLADAMAQNPTFFSLWIGNNDVLGYALSGGDGSNPITPATGAAGVGFDGTYDAIVNGMTSQGAKGVVANIPNVTSIPFFTTVPYNPLTSSVLGGGSTAVGDATIDALNSQLYGPLKQALTAIANGVPGITAIPGVDTRINLLSKTAANPLLIKDESLLDISAQLTAVLTPSLGAQQAGFMGLVFGKARQASNSDLVLLTTKGAIGAAPTASDSGIGMAPPSPLNKFGITFPMQDKHILIPTEKEELSAAVTAYNLKIKSVADAKGLAFVDANALMYRIANGGISGNGYNVTSAFVTGGGFSLDGVHPTPRGYALIANEFIKAINTTYGSNLKGVNLADYRILFPSTL